MFEHPDVCCLVCHHASTNPALIGTRYHDRFSPKVFFSSFGWGLIRCLRFNATTRTNEWCGEFVDRADPASPPLDEVALSSRWREE